MSRVVVTLGQDEREALIKLALAELRTPHKQARHILRQELQRRGLLPADNRHSEARVEGGDHVSEG